MLLVSFGLRLSPRLFFCYVSRRWLSWRYEWSSSAPSPRYTRTPLTTHHPRPTQFIQQEEGKEVGVENVGARAGRGECQPSRTSSCDGEEGEGEDGARSDMENKPNRTGRTRARLEARGGREGEEEGRSGRSDASGR